MRIDKQLNRIGPIKSGMLGSRFKNVYLDENVHLSMKRY